MEGNTDVCFKVMCLDEAGSSRKHSIEIKKGKIWTECRRARCEEVRKLFLYYSGYLYEWNRKGIPRALLQHFDMCKDIRWNRTRWENRDIHGDLNPPVSRRLNTLMEKLYPDVFIHWKRDMGLRPGQMLFLHSFFKKQAPDFDWWGALFKEWSRLNLIAIDKGPTAKRISQLYYSPYDNHWTILLFRGEEIVLTFSHKMRNGANKECGFWFRKEDQQYSCTMSAVQDTGRPYHVGPPS